VLTVAGRRASHLRGRPRRSWQHFVETFLISITHWGIIFQTLIEVCFTVLQVLKIRRHAQGLRLRFLRSCGSRLKRAEYWEPNFYARNSPSLIIYPKCTKVWPGDRKRR
jgi:hypothetical protein